jgi:hypothetical protein
MASSGSYTYSNALLVVDEATEAPLVLDDVTSLVFGRPLLVECLMLFVWVGHKTADLTEEPMFSIAEERDAAATNVVGVPTLVDYVVSDLGRVHNGVLEPTIGY